MPRKHRFLGLAFTAFTLMTTAALAGGSIHVLKSASCGCCVAWMKHMSESGFAVTAENVPMADLISAKTDAGLPAEQASCHTARIDGYVIEGHVPASDVKRLLAERPDAIGLAVPGMPYGSPGMGEPGPDADPYDVNLVRRSGTIETFASYR